MKKFYIDVRIADKKVITTAMESGVDALLADDSQIKDIQKLAVIDVIAPKGDIKLGKEIIEVEINNRDEELKAMELVKKQPNQSLLVFYSVIQTSKNRESPLFTGEVYDVYRGLCVNTNTKPLTQRRISDLIAELDMLGLLNAKVISKGRYGRTREITLSLSNRLQSKVEELVREVFGL